MEATEIWKPNPGPQERVLRLRGFYEILFGGARGGGKSEGGLIWMGPILPPNRHRRFKGLVIRKNSTDLADWIDRADAMWGPFGIKKRGNPPTFHFTEFGGKVRTGHLKDESAYTKYQGTENHKVLIEELTQIATLSRYEKLISCCRSTVPDLEPCILATCNPGGIGHSWVKERFVEPAPHGTPFQDPVSKRWRIFIRSLIDDNPVLLQSDPAYAAFLESLPEALRRAWRFGDWDSFEGQYFPEFRRDTHTCRPFEPPAHWPRYRAIDWGYFPDPWVCLWFAVDEQGHEYLYREAHGWRMTPEEVAHRILHLSEKDGKTFGPTVADPSMWARKDGVSSAEKMILAGLVVDQAVNDRVEGWMRCHEYLGIDPRNGKPWVTIFDTCTQTIKAFPLVVHDEGIPADAAENTEIDHWPDAFRYHFMRRPARAIPPKTAGSWKTYDNFMRLTNRGGV
jgi:phage terminase large subunit